MDRKDKDLPIVNPEDTGEMELFFKTTGGVLITLEFHKEETVQAVLPKVQDTLGFDFIKRTIHLKYKGEQLEESEAVTLAQYGIKPGDVLEIVVDAEKVEIFVRLENGDVLAIKIKAQATVTVLMEELAKQTGIGYQEQYLLLRGEQLDPALNLSELGLEPESELELYPLLITLRITLSNRGTVRATVDRTILYGELLNTVAPLENSTPEFVSLTLDGAELDLHESLHAQGLTTDSELVCVKEVEVVVRLEAGENITVRMSVQSSVMELMQKLAESSGLPVDSQYLVLDEEQVHRESTLDEFENHQFELFSAQVEVTVNLSNGDTVQVICNRGDSHDDLRLQVAKLEDTTPDLVHLYKDSQKLKHWQTLHLQGIRSNTVLVSKRLIKVPIEWLVGSETAKFEEFMDCHATAEDLTSFLVAKHGMSTEVQLLMVGNKPVTGKERLERQGLVVLVLPKMIRLKVVQMSTRQLFELTIERTASFDQLRAKVAEVTGLDVGDVELIFTRLGKGSGREHIDGSTTLQEIGVVDGEVVVLRDVTFDSEEEDDEEIGDTVLNELGFGGGGVAKNQGRPSPAKQKKKRGGKARKGGGGRRAKSALRGAPKRAQDRIIVPGPRLGYEMKKFEFAEEDNRSGKRGRKKPTRVPPEQEVILAPKAIDGRTSLLQKTVDEVGVDFGGGELEELPLAETGTILEDEKGEVVSVEDKKAERAERRRERRRRVLAYIKDVLRNVSVLML